MLASLAVSVCFVTHCERTDIEMKSLAYIWLDRIDLLVTTEIKRLLVRLQRLYEKPEH